MELDLDEIELWDLVDESTDEEIGNRYLRNKEEGISLIARLVPLKRPAAKLGAVRSFIRMVEQDFFYFFHTVQLPDSLKTYQQLKKLKERLIELESTSLLDTRSVVALGGGFSAGKSKFINSLLKKSVLPEELTPTTSLPTYITSGPAKLSAFTWTNQEAELDAEAVEALSHAFHQEYQFSFTKIIKHILIQDEELEFPNIVLMDTPGYTKSESYKKEDNTDEFTAREHLQTADYLIWLMDIENGAITERDLAFLAKLDFAKPILFVFNKADKVPMASVKVIVAETEEVLKGMGIQPFAVTACSSLQGREYGATHIGRFLRKAEQAAANKATLDVELEHILQQYERILQAQLTKLEDQNRRVKLAIGAAETLEQLGGLSAFYTQINQHIHILKKRRREFWKMQRKAVQLMKVAVQESSEGGRGNE